MCGIAGFFHKQEPEEARKLLSQMLYEINHRGPDDSSGVVGGNFALGNVRLSIVDIEGGSQPGYSSDNQVTIVFNGEIFNYKKLRSDLKNTKGVVFKTNSEIETLVQLYLAYGEHMVKMLNGQFAIAIYDNRQKSLILMRDPFGIRPLYWCLDSNKNLGFSSEIKGLRPFTKTSLTIDKESLIQTINFWTNIGDSTSFKEVRQVPAGSLLKYQNGIINFQKYWQFPINIPGNILRLKNEEEYFERFREELQNATERQSQSDVEVASYVSGGIDSAALAFCLKRRQNQVPLKTFSVSFGDHEYDESKFQQEVVSSLGIENETLRITSDDIANIFPKVVRHAETFLFRTAPAPLYLLAEKVRESGIKVIMTGEGADEILLGYDIFRESKIRRFWSRQPNSIWRGMLLKSLYHYLPQFRNPRYSKMSLEFYRGSIESKSSFYPMDIRWGNNKKCESILSDNFIDDLGAYNPLDQIQKFLPLNFEKFSDIEKTQHIEVAGLLSNYLLSSQGDRMTMAQGVEGRYPFLDIDFVNFCSRLPEKMKLNVLKDKYILRKSFEKDLPKNILGRKKFAYQAPEMKAFFKNGVLVDYAADLLSEGSIKNLGIFDYKKLSHLIKRGGESGESRLGFAENMAFVVALSTSLLSMQFCTSSNGNEYLRHSAHRNIKILEI